MVQQQITTQVYRPHRLSHVLVHVRAAILCAACAAAAAIIYPPRVSQDSLCVGDEITLTIPLVLPPGAQVISPETEHGFGRFEVRNWSVDTLHRGSSDSLAYTYVLSLYTTEQCTIPSLAFVHVQGDSTFDTLLSQPVAMRVISLVASDTADIRDLKPQQTAGKPPLWWLWTLGAVVAAAAAAWLGRFLWIRSRREPPPPPPKPPYDEAIEGMGRLEAKQYLMKAMVREYVFELSDILKRYIERRFNTNASEYTTEEMLYWVESAPLDSSLRRSLEWFFTSSDPVKFAKHVPERETIMRFGPEARSFVENTRPSPQPAVAETPKNEGDGSAV